MTWDDLGAGARALAEAAHADGYVPDVILAVSRGGLLPPERLRTRSELRTRSR